jgi:hypothetical protein
VILLRLRAALAASLVALAFILATPLLDRATAAPNNGGGGKVTCAGGGEPGDVQTTHTYYYVNGKLVAKVTGSAICGKDGQWHIVAPLVSAVNRPRSGASSFPDRCWETHDAELCSVPDPDRSTMPVGEIGSNRRAGAPGALISKNGRRLRPRRRHQ